MKYIATFLAAVALFAISSQAADTASSNTGTASTIDTNAPHYPVTFDERLSRIMSNSPADSTFYKRLRAIRASATNNAPEHHTPPAFAEPLKPLGQLMPPITPPPSLGSNAVGTNAELQMKVQALQEWRERKEQQTNGAPLLPPLETK